MTELLLFPMLSFRLVRNLSSLPLITEWLPFKMKNLDNPLYSSYNADKCRISIKVNVMREDDK